MSDSPPILHSVVELRMASGRWPAGTVGTVVQTHDEGALVEIADDQGRTLDLLSLPYDALSPVAPTDQGRLRV